jgi:protein TonB
MAYRSAERNDRWKAMVAAIVVTGVLGAGILSGLNVKMVRQAVDRLQTFDISLPKPPPEEPPPPPPQEQKKAAPEEAAPAAPKASPIVAPKPEVQLQTKQVIAAARQAGTGASSQSGQGGVGTGTGAGGTGSGRGGGGAGFTPAQKITKIPNREYRQLVAVSGFERGTVGLSVRVTPDGRATNCRVVRSSGSSRADILMCQLTERYIRFRPARDPAGRAVAQDVTWYPNWFRP